MPDDEEDGKQYPRNPAHLDGVPDMSALIYLEEPVSATEPRCARMHAFHAV